VGKGQLQRQDTSARGSRIADRPIATGRNPAPPSSGVLELLLGSDLLAFGARLGLASSCQWSGHSSRGLADPHDPALLGSPWCTHLAAASQAAGSTLIDSRCEAVF